MIKSLIVQNFQKIEKAEFDLHSGLNVFVGKSGAGKSAGVVRPLRLLTFNQPLGDSYLYDPEITGNEDWKGGETRVEVFLEDGTQIARGKSSNDNYYELNGLKFRAFGKKPPEDIQKALNLSFINFQFQHDRLFLLDMGEADLARLLNEIAGLDLIDKTRSNINKRLWNEQQELNNQKTLKDKLTEDLKKYDGLEDLDSTVMVLEEIEKRIEEKRPKIQRMKTLSSRLLSAQEDLDLYSDLEALASKYKLLQEKAVLLLQKQKAIKDTQDLAERLVHIKSQADRFQQLETAISWVELAVKRLESHREGSDRIKNMKGLLKRLEEWADIHYETEKEIKEIETRFHDMMPESCPLCGHEQVKD